MKVQTNTPLAPLTSFGVGGPAENLITIEQSDDVKEAFAGSKAPVWYLGYGSNSLISDAGLSGTTLLFRNANIMHEGNTVIAESGAWWDDLVQFAITENLWGLELMSAIPGGVGAAIIGNIAAYGQAVADSLAWIEIFEPMLGEKRRLFPEELGLSYRYSDLQAEGLKQLVILRAAFNLKSGPTSEVTYQSALDTAAAGGYDLLTLDGRRSAILDARKSAGSLWDYRNPEDSRTAGSFFRNPLVDTETAELLMASDETGRSADLLRKMNQVHGGSQKRVSASHVLLAAGYQRGQTWGAVRLHPQHILKIENTGGATAQDIYDVAHEIVATVKEKLAIDLIPEVRFIGQFK